jgi:hypothetical protein
MVKSLTRLEPDTKLRTIRLSPPREFYLRLYRSGAHATSTVNPPIKFNLHTYQRYPQLHPPLKRVHNCVWAHTHPHTWCTRCSAFSLRTLIPTCDRTPLKSRGLSFNIISGDFQRRENIQTQHINIQYHDIQVIK